MASFGSGQLLHTVGWSGIDIGMQPLVVIVLAIMAWQARQNKELATRA